MDASPMAAGGQQLGMISTHGGDLRPSPFQPPPPARPDPPECQAQHAVPEPVKAGAQTGVLSRTASTHVLETIGWASNERCPRSDGNGRGGRPKSEVVLNAWWASSERMPLNSERGTV